MEELRDLNIIYNEANQRFLQYDGKDFVLPDFFKNEVKEINSNCITYNKYSAVIETRGNQNGGLHIFLPNQWFYIASYFTDLYNELQKYKEAALLITSKERLKILNGKELNENEIRKLNNLSLSDESKERLVKFITDYSWWSGAKTIDRADFYVSPILNSARLVNASQSFVADLCAYLSDKSDLVASIINDNNLINDDLGNPFAHLGNLQQIFYGAPGTGKSFTINRDTKGEDVIRTTFHPDTDYSSFVGAYKPTMKDAVKKQSKLDYEALVDKLKEYIIQQQQNITKACTMFGFDYHDSIVEMQEVSSHTIVQLVADGYKSGTTYDSHIRAGMSVYENSGINEVDSEQIVYRFVFQSFLQAYVKAWTKYAEAGSNTPKKQFLIIEEINRGNCAQIFGDLFQLLDRNDKGFSDYPITADADMKKQLKRAFSGKVIANKMAINALYDGRDVVSEVLNGDILLLPNNLYIWATMNTSDQSLFPIDSAFKRRWNWRYIPISNRNEGYKIAVNGNYYDWWEFLEAINARIWDANHSEDKKLGYFFAKADGNNIIDSELFVGKVIFYLWNDVFKDFIEESGDIFNDEDGGKLSFDKFYETMYNGDTKVVENKAEQFLKNLGLEPCASDNIEEDNLKDFKVIYNGQTFNEGNSSDTFVKVLEAIGLEKLVDKEFDNCVVVTKTQPTSSRIFRQSGDYCIYIGLWAKYKKRWLRVMAESMQLDLQVEE